MPSTGFQAAIENFYEPLYRFGYSLSGNRPDACDLVQQTFLIWARQGESLRNASKIKPWLFTTLYREFLKLHRYRQRVVPVEEPEDAIDAEDNTPDWIARLDIPAVVQGLATIDPLFRQPLILFYLENKSYKEIAKELDAPIGTIMSRLARGKKQLKRALSEGAAVPQIASGQTLPNNPAPKHPLTSRNHG